MTVSKVWISKNTEVSDEQLKNCFSDKVFAALLQNRGIDTKEKIEAFLNPLKRKLLDPDVFVDMQKTVDRIKLAIDKKENITVYGDFDTDGITASAVLYMTLKKIGANVSYYLPHRVTESHGLNIKALINIISKKQSKLIITVDCGISNVKEVKFAKEHNADIIITDHHEAPEVLPEAFSVLNPKAQNSLSDNLTLEELQSLNYLAGVGVAFKLSCKLLLAYGFEKYVYELLPLAAVGTIGDVVELIGENRTLAAMGIQLIKQGRHYGIQKILSSSNIPDIKNITSQDIAFSVVPRLNAAGRLELPDTAFNILISQDGDDINSDIEKLNQLNTERQELCEKIFLQARKMYEDNISSNKKSIILFNPEWHIGVIGIVASKLTEAYNKPSFLMTLDPNNSEIIRCSSRSIEALDIYSVLSEHKDLFEGFGGHKMAAGFSFNSGKISFENFKNALNKTIDEHLPEMDFSKVTTYADMEVEPSDITIDTVKRINLMEPFGQGNPVPEFIMNNIKLKQYKLMGQNENHLKIYGEKDGVNIEAVKWNTPDFSAKEGVSFDILFNPQINEFNGNTTVQYMISDIHGNFIKDNKEADTVKILDHRKKSNILKNVLEFLDTTKKKTCIYLENSKLKKEISEKALNISFGINNIPENVEQLMFFDCPPSKDEFRNIVKTTGADIIHLMNFNLEQINTDNIISTLSGMLRYSVNNMKGKIDIERLSNSLNIDNEITVNILDIFDDVNMADIEQLSDTEYKINSLKPVELSKIKQHDLYKAVDEKINEINTFRKLYLSADIDDIKELVLK